MSQQGTRRIILQSLSTAALLGSTLPALAQSVTIYGILDTGAERVTNVGASKSSLSRMPSLTGSLPSRLGFRGSEDLGDGFKANFVLEQGIAPDQGTLNQGGRAFGRQAYVGLSGGWGALTFGRQYTMTYIALLGASTIGPNIYSSAGLDSYLPNARVDNSIGYSGSFSGFTVGATYSLGRDAVAPAPAGGCAGESSTDSKACRDYSAMLKYDSADWGTALSYERLYGGAGAGSPLPSSSQTDTRTMLNGYVRLAGSKVGGGVIRRKNEGSATPDSNLLYLGVSYPTGLWLLDAEYSRLDVKDSPSDSSMLALRAMYNFSKRTAAYLTAGHISNKGSAALSVSAGSVAGAAPLPGVGQTGVMLGLRHIF
jgi:predicted porin